MLVCVRSVFCQSDLLDLSLDERRELLIPSVHLSEALNQAILPALQGLKYSSVKQQKDMSSCIGTGGRRRGLSANRKKACRFRVH